MSSKSHIVRDAHVVAVLHMDGYYLCDYGVYGPLIHLRMQYTIFLIDGKSIIKMILYMSCTMEYI